jgi:hypothetical protein
MGVAACIRQVLEILRWELIIAANPQPGPRLPVGVEDSPAERTERFQADRDQKDAR